MTTQRAKRCNGSRNGIALLAVLAFILLLTIVIVAFISFARLNRLSTVSYGRSVEADEIAKGGLQDVISDLRMEIIAGSVKDPNGSTFTQSGTTMYLPATNVTAMPARIGYAATSYGTDTTTTTLSPSLVRVSRATGNLNALNGDVFFTNLTANKGSYTNNIAVVPGGTILNRASLASTATSSYNGRSISPTRWNKAILLAPNTSSIPSPFTTAPPDWVYVTRTGSRVCAANEVTTGALSSTASVTQTYAAPVAGTNPVASPVLGRYAFVMYDEGALLDANVAGYTSTAAVAGVNYSDPTTGIVQAVNGKSYLCYADLTQLPGLSGAQSVVDNFVNWRNASAAAAAGTAITGPNYIEAVFTDSLNGFKKFQSNTTTGLSDSPLLERQDLINYFANLDATGGTTYSTVLPYLGTFTRAVSAPSYSPPTDVYSVPSTSLSPSAPYGVAPAAVVSNLYKYKSDAELSTGSPFSTTQTIALTATSVSPTCYATPGPNPNRDLPNVRFATGGTITHYNDDPTTPVQYTVNAGDPLMQSRFSLARIGWLSSSSIGGADPAPNGANPGDLTSMPSTKYVAAILSCFGLQWGKPGGGAANGGNPCWTYVGSSGGAGSASSIETLDQVATENREPNFFELLKASILAGSVGLGTGRTGWSNGTNSVSDPGGSSPDYDFTNKANFGGGVEGLDAYSFDGHLVPNSTPTVPAPSMISDMQILKIGADIIDEYDADSYPTAIYFNYSGMTPAFDAALPASPDHMLFGEANMVFGEENLPYITGLHFAGGTVKSTDAGDMNGWCQPEIWNMHQLPASFPSQAPTVSKLQIRAYGQADMYWSYNFTPPTGNKTGSTSGLVDGSYITLDLTGAGSQFLCQSPWPVVNNQSGISCTPSDLTHMIANPAMTNGTSNPFVAFWMGDDPTFQVCSPTTYPGEMKLWDETTGFTVALGWVDGSNGFHPYSFIINPLGQAYGVFGSEKGSDYTGSADPSVCQIASHVPVDARTTRVSTYGCWEGGDFKTNFYPSVAYPGRGGDQMDPQWGGPMGFISPPSGGLISYFYAYAAQANGAYPPEDWAVNSYFPPASTGATKTYIRDRDGVIRPGDGIYSNPANGDGLSLFCAQNGTPTASPAAAGDTGNVSHGRRPVILNRPFRSVAEMGYAYRDLPFKTLDFFSAASADAALLDVFSLTDDSKISNQQLTSVVAGQLNINNAPLPVIESVLSGGSKKDFDPTYNLGAEVTGTTGLAAQIEADLNPTTGPNPIVSRAGLVTVISPTLQTKFSNSTDQSNKAYLEAPIRALSDVTNTRTWNLMIDIIAQSGQMAPSAKTLNDFVVQSERRYWLHLAIDRYTGKIVAQQLEPVYE